MVNLFYINLMGDYEHMENEVLYRYMRHRGIRSSPQILAYCVNSIIKEICCILGPVMNACEIISFETNMYLGSV